MVCDGHSGTKAADFISTTLTKKLEKAPLASMSCAWLRTTIQQVDVALLTHMLSTMNPEDLFQGTTLALAIDTPQGVFLASVGDSLAAVMDAQGRLVQTLGIKQSLPYTLDGRLDGGINIDAALGDWHLKDKRLYARWHGNDASSWPSTKRLAQYAGDRGYHPMPWPDAETYAAVFHEPLDPSVPMSLIENAASCVFLSRDELPADYAFVLASDGVTDSLSDLQTTLTAVARRPRSHHAEWLTAAALEANLADNVTHGLLVPMDTDVYAMLPPGPVARRHLGANGRRRKIELTMRDLRDDMTSLIVWRQATDTNPETRHRKARSRLRQSPKQPLIRRPERGTPRA
jgi:serine/threonine protein phosphatase PrpC